MLESSYKLDIEKYKVVRELFINPADEDYIISRLFYFNKLGRQFFWSAAQAIEKYLKASLLLNNHTIKFKNRNGHDITRLFEEVKSFAEDFILYELTPEEEIKEFLCGFKFNWGDSKSLDFVNRVNKHGAPSNRYNHFGTNMEWSDLFKLDQFIFCIRNLTINLDMPSSWGRPIGLGNIDISYRELLSQKPREPLFDFNSKLVSQEEASQALYVAARENNFPFFRDSYLHRPLEKLSILSYSDALSPLEAIYAPALSGFFSEEIKLWIKDKIPLNNADKERLGINNAG